jgi:hypothetical protein
MSFFSVNGPDLLWGPPSLSGAHVPLVKGLGHQSNDSPPSSAEKNGWSQTSTPPSTVELHLSGLIGTASHSDMQKIQIIGFFFKIGYIFRFNFGCYYLQQVPAPKPSDHTLFVVLNVIKLYWT